MNTKTGNTYLISNGDTWTTIPLERNPSETHGWGKDYYVEVFRILEEHGTLRGITFYLSKFVPSSLPRADRTTVLVITGDEYYRSFKYFADLLAVIRCYGDRPRYLDGFPTNLLKLGAFLQFIFKLSVYCRYWFSTGCYSPSRAKEIKRRTLHVPLGCFGPFLKKPVEFSCRTIDYAFLGSVEYQDHKRFSLGRMLRSTIKPPKIEARLRMTEALSLIARTSNHWKSKLQITETFLDRIARQDTYASAMSNCKVSICPRGSNYETYRFNESCKMACVIICEPIPQVWFHDKHPGIVIRDWNKLPQILESLLSDQPLLKSHSERAQAFWESHLAENMVAKKIEAFILSFL